MTRVETGSLSRALTRALLLIFCVVVNYRSCELFLVCDTYGLVNVSGEGQTCNLLLKWIVRPVCTGHPIFDRVRCEEVVPPVFIRDTRPKSVVGRRTPPVHRKDPDV